MNLLEHTPPKLDSFATRSVRPAEPGDLKPLAANQIDLLNTDRLINLEMSHPKMSQSKSVEPDPSLTQVGPVMLEVVGVSWALILLAFAGATSLLGFESLAHSLLMLAMVAIGIVVGLVAWSSILKRLR